MAVTASTPFRTGWEDDTPAADTLALACLRAMADRAADWPGRPVGACGATRHGPGRRAVALPLPQRRMQRTRCRRDRRPSDRRVLPGGPPVRPDHPARHGRPGPSRAAARGSSTVDGPPCRRGRSGHTASVTVTEVRDAGGLAVCGTGCWPPATRCRPRPRRRRCSAAGRGSGWRAWTASRRRPPCPTPRTASSGRRGRRDPAAVPAPWRGRGGHRGGGRSPDPALPAVLMQQRRRRGRLPGPGLPPGHPLDAVVADVTGAVTRPDSASPPRTRRGTGRTRCSRSAGPPGRTSGRDRVVGAADVALEVAEVDVAAVGRTPATPRFPRRPGRRESPDLQPQPVASCAGPPAAAPVSRRTGAAPRPTRCCRARGSRACRARSTTGSASARTPAGAAGARGHGLLHALVERPASTAGTPRCR